MARQQWIIELKKAGLDTSDERLAVVAQFLVDNYLTSLKRLRAVGNPASWPGSAVLLDDECAFLASMTDHGVRRGADRSRSRGRRVVMSNAQVRC